MSSHHKKIGYGDFHAEGKQGKIFTIFFVIIGAGGW